MGNCTVKLNVPEKGGQTLLASVTFGSAVRVGKEWYFYTNGGKLYQLTERGIPTNSAFHAGLDAKHDSYKMYVDEVREVTLTIH